MKGCCELLLSSVGRVCTLRGARLEGTLFFRNRFCPFTSCITRIRLLISVFEWIPCLQNVKATTRDYILVSSNILHAQ